MIYKYGHRPLLMNWKQFERKQSLLLGVLSQHSPGEVKNSVKKFRMANDLARIQTRYFQNTKQVTICGPSACEGILFLSHTESGLCN